MLRLTSTFTRKNVLSQMISQDLIQNKRTLLIKSIVHREKKISRTLYKTKLSITNKFTAFLQIMITFDETHILI